MAGPRSQPILCRRLIFYVHYQRFVSKWNLATTLDTAKQPRKQTHQTSHSIHLCSSKHLTPTITLAPFVEFHSFIMLTNEDDCFGPRMLSSSHVMTLFNLVRNDDRFSLQWMTASALVPQIWQGCTSKLNKNQEKAWWGMNRGDRVRIYYCGGQGRTIITNRRGHLLGW